jgi:hypothetical protein
MHAAHARVESKIVLGSGLQRMIAMTRPLTKRELTSAAMPPVASPTRHDIFVPQFLIAAVCRGMTFGICFAVFVLLTDSFGIYSLIIAQAAPVTIALIFVLVSSFKFVALSIALAVGLVAYSK